MQDNTIKPGDYIVIQRQDYMKLHKLKEHGNVNMGSFVVELDNIVGGRYFDTFQMIAKPGAKKTYWLDKVDEITTVAQLNIEKSGKDNRNITDDGDSQNLSKDDIVRLRDEDLSSNAIVEKLITNSKTFASKTEYSQEKYLKKKEKKYFEYIQIRRPTIRLLAQLFYRQDPAKMQGLRPDDLSQILTYSNIQSVGNYILYDSGTSGLVVAALIHALGPQSPAQLIHMHPGNECQKNALIAMQFPPEQNERCINVNIYSVLRCFHQNNGNYENDNEGGEPPKKRPCWQHDNQKACAILKEKVDGLIVVCKEHPVNVVGGLVDFLKGGRNLVVFNLLKEPLQDLYGYLKGRTDFINIRVSNNFLRYYQVLPERTHPQVNMNSGGYVLSATKLAC